MTSLYNFSFMLDETKQMYNGIAAGADYADAVANVTNAFKDFQVSRLMVESMNVPTILIGDPKPIPTTEEIKI